jgi:hypothetical protein
VHDGISGFKSYLEARQQTDNILCLFSKTFWKKLPKGFFRWRRHVINLSGQPWAEDLKSDKLTGYAS